MRQKHPMIDLRPTRLSLNDLAFRHCCARVTTQGPTTQPFRASKPKFTESGGANRQIRPNFAQTRHYLCAGAPIYPGGDAQNFCEYGDGCESCAGSGAGSMARAAYRHPPQLIWRPLSYLSRQSEFAWQIFSCPQPEIFRSASVLPRRLCIVHSTRRSAVPCWPVLQPYRVGFSRC